MKHTVRYLEVRRRASGESYFYWNPPRDAKKAGVLHGAPLGTDFAEAAAKAEKYNTFLDGWREDKNKVVEEVAKAGSLNALVDEYYKSRFFRKLKSNTQKHYAYCLRRLCELELKDGQKLGEVSILRIKPRAVDAIYEKLQNIQDGKPTTPALANSIMRVASALWSVAGRWEYVSKSDNPFYDMGKEGTKKRYVTWSPQQIRAFCAKAVEMQYHSMALAVMLQYELAQRQGDVLNLTWDSYDGDRINFTQNKTAREMWLPVSSELKTFLDMTARTSPYVVVSESTGTRYSPSLFRQRLRLIRAAAGLPDELTSGDLRRTAATELGDAGATEAEIMANGGWTNPVTVQRYKLRTDTQAVNGMRKRWDKRKQEWTE